jgi:hypothetical protein
MHLILVLRQKEGVKELGANVRLLVGQANAMCILAISYNVNVHSHLHRTMCSRKGAVSTHLALMLQARILGFMR